MATAFGVVQFARRGLRHYLREHVLVAAATEVAVAVLVGALVIGEGFSTAVSERTDEDCLFVAGVGTCGLLVDFGTTTLDTPSILLITYGDEAFDPTPNTGLLTPGDVAFRASEFRAPMVANPERRSLDTNLQRRRPPSCRD